jgi:hypothetical protein
MRLKFVTLCAGGLWRVRQLGGPPGKALVICEERREDWDKRHQQLGLGHVAFFCRPFRHRPRLAEWVALLEHGQAGRCQEPAGGQGRAGVRNRFRQAGGQGRAGVRNRFRRGSRRDSIFRQGRAGRDGQVGTGRCQEPFSPRFTS